MTFASGSLVDIGAAGSGERFSKLNTVLSSVTFQDGLIPGRFAKLDTGSIDNFDGSVDPVPAGVVLREPTDAVEDAGVIDADVTTIVNYMRFGLVTVDVKAGETPTMFERVYISNAGDANDGLATATNTDEVANAEFIQEVATNVWLIYVTPAPGDVATHIADATGAHAASAISLLDAGGFTTATELEAALAELYPVAAAAIADPGDAGAIPVTRSGNVAITTTGVVDTRTLAIPTTVGVRLVLSLDVDAGNAVITVASAANQAGNNTLTMADAGDIIELVAVQVGGVLAWRITANDGVALTTV